MSSVIKTLRDMEIDEISLVDRPATAHAKVVIAKRATQEETVPEDVFNEDGEVIDVSELSEGDVVFDEEGNPFLIVEDDEPEGELQTEQEAELEDAGVSKGIGNVASQFVRGLKGVAGPAPTKMGQTAHRTGAHIARNKLAYGAGTAAVTGAGGAYALKKNDDGKTFAEELREELSKSLTDIERDEVISKAFAQVEEMQESLAQAEEIAKSERDLRLVREYEEVAKSYNLPIPSDELAPVLMAIAEELPYEYGEVIHKALSAAGEIIFEEYGTEGAGSNNDVLTAVDAYIDENVSKSDISKAEAVEAVFDANPGAYDEYMATRYFG